jgi:hypothetical protein
MTSRISNNNNNHTTSRSQSDVEISFDGDGERHPDDGHDVDDEYYDRKESKQNRKIFETIHFDKPTRVPYYFLLAYPQASFESLFSLIFLV